MREPAAVFISLELVICLKILSHWNAFFQLDFDGSLLIGDISASFYRAIFFFASRLSLYELSGVVAVAVPCTSTLP